MYPTAGTIFQDTRTPLQVWFYAIYLFVTTRHGVSGKELERTLGVTYKTAWRMGQQIRKLMEKANGFEMMQGHVEMDEAYVGGYMPGAVGRGANNKTIVFGIKERGGRVMAEAVPNVKAATLSPIVDRNVKVSGVFRPPHFPLALADRRTAAARRFGSSDDGRRSWRARRAGRLPDRCDSSCRSR